MTYVGWYAVKPVAEVKPTTVHGFRLDGRDWVLYRTGSGAFRVAENRCVHLGGRLDRTGEVRGEELVCTLHGYGFDEAGRAARPKDGCPLGRVLEQLPVQVHAGMVFAWYDPAGEAPRFDLPELDATGFSAMSFRVLELDTRPELIMQDLVDVAHYETIHDYRNIAYEQAPSFEPHRLSVAVRFDWDTTLPGRARNLPARFKSEARGVGYQLTETWSVFERYHTRHLVLPVPVDEHRCRIYLGTCARIHGRLGRGLVGRGVRKAAHHFIVQMFKRDIARDARLWVDTYPLDDRLPPDEAIARYRRWLDGFRPHIALEASA